MGVKLLMHQGMHNTAHQHPVQVTWGSNSFHVDRGELEPLLDLLDPIESVTPAGFLADYWEPFIRRFADR